MTQGEIFWGEQGPLTTDSICIPAVMKDTYIAFEVERDRFI